jgi:V8-like Glu-specific endopeptidase
MTAPDGLEDGFGINADYHSAICQICSSFGFENGQELLEWGTGVHFFSRNGSSYILTAGHVVFSHKFGRRLFEDAQVYFGRSGDTAVASRKAYNRWAPEAFKHSIDADPKWDFGVLRVDLEPGKAAKILRFGSTAPTAPRVKLVGYPNVGPTEGLCQPFNTEIDLLPIESGNFDYNGGPTYAGMSGGPLLRYFDDGLLYTWGVHVRGEEAGQPRRAVRLNQRNLSIINGWLGV